MLRKTAAGSVCDDHPELGAMTELDAWRHLETAHTVTAEWSRRVADEIAAANAPVRSPRKRRGKRRGKRRRS